VSEAKEELGVQVVPGEMHLKDLSAQGDPAPTVGRS
jgi:hypothetical protein